MQQQAHYVCDECKGVSDVAKACGTEGCGLNGQPLTDCDCEMPEHLEKAETAKKAREEESND